jgi:hypothetical protein
LADLLDWLGDQPGKAYARLVSWQRLAIDRLAERHREWRDRALPGHEVVEARPRIEISAYVNQKENLIVRWYPAGWLASGRAPAEPTDFRGFRDQDVIGTAWGQRPDNELLWLRGVGALRPEPTPVWLSNIGINREVGHSILICAVRSAYEGLVRNLARSCQVSVLQSFGFQEEEEMDEAGHTVRRVVGWWLEDRGGGAI